MTTLQIKLTDLNHQGQAVGRPLSGEGKVHFISGGLPGEIVEVDPASLCEKKNFISGNLRKILTASTDRREPVCPLFGQCGGCQFLHYDYQAQLAWKRSYLVDRLYRLASLDLTREDLFERVSPVIGMDDPFFYRNHVQLKYELGAEGPVTGFYQTASHRLVYHETCYLNHPSLNQTKAMVDAFLQDLYQIQAKVSNRDRLGLSLLDRLQEIVLRTGLDGKTIQVKFCLAGRKGSLQEPGAFSSYQELLQPLYRELKLLCEGEPGILVTDLQAKGQRTQAIYGQTYLLDALDQVQFKIDSSSFFQVNSEQTVKLYDCIADFAQIREDDRVLDLYCGLGSIGIYLLAKSKAPCQLTGIEINQKSIELARENARLNGLTTCKFLAGKAEENSLQLADFDLVLIDPPRRGLADKLLRQLVRQGPEGLIYVSCNPDSLARDLAKLKDRYRISTIQPVDMFPQTGHVESVVLMSREG